MQRIVSYSMLGQWSRSGPRGGTREHVAMRLPDEHQKGGVAGVLFRKVP